MLANEIALSEHQPVAPPLIVRYVAISRAATFAVCIHTVLNVSVT